MGIDNRGIYRGGAFAFRILQNLIAEYGVWIVFLVKIMKKDLGLK